MGLVGEGCRRVDPGGLLGALIFGRKRVKQSFLYCLGVKVRGVGVYGHREFVGEMFYEIV